MRQVFSLGTVILWIAAAAGAAVLRVPADHATIQAAINLAQDGDTVIVNAGIYKEQISFQGKAITVTSVDPNDPNVVGSTVIDGTGLSAKASVVTFDHNETLAATLAGFTIRGGYGTLFIPPDYPQAQPPLYWGSGVCCMGASPTIVHNRITANKGPVSMSQGQPIGYGGGIACLQSNAVIAYNTITENDSYAGGGVLVFYGQAVISNNLICSNSAVIGGGVILLGGRLIGNTIAKNMATIPGSRYGSGPIGGLYVAFEGEDVTCSVFNNIIASNLGGGMAFEGNPPEGEEWFAFNDVWNNRPQNYVTLNPAQEAVDWTGDYGNICQDPLFVDAQAGDYHLRMESPCIDAGDPGFEPPLGQTDLDGDSRIWGAFVDIGADEYPACSRPMAEAGPDQWIDVIGLITLDGSGSSFCDPCAVKLFRWTEVAGPEVALSDPCAVQPTFVPAVEGYYRFQLIVSDGTHDSKPDDVLIRVGNKSPIADAGDDVVCRVPGQARLDGSASADPDGDVLTYHWRQTAGPEVQLADANTAAPHFDCLQEGAYEFELVVSDGRRASTADMVKVTTVMMTIQQQPLDAGFVTSDFFHYPDVDGTRVVYGVGPASDFTWDIKCKDLKTGQIQTFRSVGSGSDMDTQPKIHGDTVVWCGGPLFGNPWYHEPSNEGVLAAGLSTGRVYTLRPYTQTSSYSHPAVWGTKVVWLEHRNLDLNPPGEQANRWWNTTYSICGADINNPDRPVYFTIAPNVGTRDPYPCYSYESDFDGVIDLWGNTVVWEANGDIYGADISDLNDIRVFTICNHPARQTDPAIYGDMVVWTDTRNDMGDIYGADISRHDAIHETALVKAPGNQSQPSLDGHILAYLDDATVKACLLVEGHSLDIPLEGAPRGMCPAVSGEVLVWQTSPYGQVQGISLKVDYLVAGGLGSPLGQVLGFPSGPLP